MQLDVKEAARRLLDTHDALRATDDREPAVNPKTDVPVDRVAWERWYRDQYRPAYDTWNDAMRAFARIIGERHMTAHPFTFRPLCDAILAGWEWARIERHLYRDPNGRVSGWAKTPQEDA